MTSSSPGPPEGFEADAFALATAFEPRPIDARSIVTLIIFFAVSELA